VGFIRDLPHGLVAAFRATLEETVHADLLLHVVDAANPHHPEQIQEVQRVLHEIGAGDVPQLLVFNKIDALPEGQQPRQPVDRIALEGQLVPRVFASSRTGEGLPALRAELLRIVEKAHGQGGIAPGSS
jgi:GTP-binding protein HflX